VIQKKLLRELEGLVGDVCGGFRADDDVRESTVLWLLDLAKRAAFGPDALELEEFGATKAFGALESIAREPAHLEARIRRGRSRVRAPIADFVVELRDGDELLAEGAAPLLSVAVINAARSLARA
jgi:hypothetical protein